MNGIGVKGKAPYVIEGTRSMMGTSVTITAIHSSSEEAKEAVNLAFSEMRRVEDLMSVYREHSEVSILNRKGFIENASAETVYVIKKAIHYSELSGGAFSIGVLPLLDLWEERLKAGRFPTDKEINDMLELADYKNIVIDGRDVRFLKGGMRITLGGIAKGYAVDRAIETLMQSNIRHAMVNAGGDIRVIGKKAEGFPWRVAVRDPKNKRRFVTVVELCDRAVATSGGYERYIGKEMKVSHIIDARTGQPSQELMSTTIIAKSAVDADALSTVVFLLGLEGGMELVERLDGVEALVITKEGKSVRSSNFKIYETQSA
jgi:thiamine biosynthesis lipoprotein